MKELGHIIDDIYPRLDSHLKRKTVRGVLITDKDEIALLHILCNDIFGCRNHFELPGGGIEENELPIQALIREMREEIGATIRDIVELGTISISYNLLKRDDVANCFLSYINQLESPNYTNEEKRFINKIIYVPITDIFKFYNINKSANIGQLIHRRDLIIIKNALKLNLRLAKISEIDSVARILKEGQSYIKSYGSPQWQDSDFNIETIESSINHNKQYVIEILDNIVATVQIHPFEEDYIPLKTWSNNSYIAIHRLSITDQWRSKHLSPIIFDLIINHAKSFNIKSLRIDTHELNLPMKNFLNQFGFIYRGIIFLSANGEERLAYEYII